VKQHQTTITVATRRGLTDITGEVREAVRGAGIATGLCTIYIRHTSASLVIQENADPAVLVDLEAFLSRLVRDGDPLFTHVDEGDDDMPSHVKSAITKTSEVIPVANGAPALGTWQAIYVWEHRRGARRRAIVVHIIGE
jgi:secondary thiamine-phosphate synthase enzyme